MCKETDFREDSHKFCSNVTMALGGSIKETFKDYVSHYLNCNYV